MNFITYHFYQKDWKLKKLKRWNIKTALRKKAKTDFASMNNAVFWKTMENVRKHRDIKLVTIEKRRNHFVSESNFREVF